MDMDVTDGSILDTDMKDDVTQYIKSWGKTTDTAYTGSLWIS